MPPQPGEVPLCTLFADVHYYFSHPSVKPPHHRFDKRSYLYLYHDALNRRGRLEIANYAGTPEQDAFMGYLDSISVEYSYKHPTLFTITVDPHGASSQTDLSQWCLPAADPQNQGKYMYKLHTVDVYLWTGDDASLLLDSLKRVLAEGQLHLLDVPPGVAEHRDSMSPIVQQLEKAAISTPPTQYQRSGSISTTHTSHSQPTALSNATPVSPPSSPPTAADPNAQAGAQQQPGFTQIAAYNPAAPAAPEPIAHREKTPPPPDAESGTGLSAAAKHDTVPQFAGPPVGQPSFGPQAGAPYFSGPPSAVAAAPPPGQPVLQRSATSGYGPTPPQQSPYGPTFPGPPVHDPNAHLYAQAQAQQQPQQHPGLTRASTFGGHTPSSPPATTTQFATYPSALQQQAPPQVSPYGPQPGTPGVIPSAVPSAASVPQQPPPSSPTQQQPPSYQQQQYAYGQHNTANIHHDIHSMVYRPEEGAAPGKAGPGAAGPGKLEQRASKLEKKVNRFFKRLDQGV